MVSFYRLCLILITITIANESPNNDHSTDTIGSVLNGYAAILDRIGKIYKLVTNSNPSNKEQHEFIAKNRHKLETELLKNAKNKNEKDIIHELLNEYNILEPINENENENENPNKYNDYYVPIIDDIFDFKPKIEEKPLNDNNKNNAQYEYIRRRLQQEQHPDITCNNTNNNNNNNNNKYDTDYNFMFEPFLNCNISNNNNTILNITEEITTINITNTPILYSSNCEFMLILNGINGELQVIASQQTIPMWSSNTNINNVNSIYSLQFNSSNGNLNIFNGNNILWSTSNTSQWNNNNNIEWESPYNLILSNNMGELYIKDNNSEIKWYSNGISENNKMNFRERIFRVNLTDNNNNNNVLLSMLMNVWLITHNNNKHFHLYFDYDIPFDYYNESNNNIIKEYINIMLLEEYKFNVSVYELSSNNIGDKYIIYDPNLPMIYPLLYKKYSDRLSISESHTFLCIDNNTRYFNINIIPFTYNISIKTNNYSLLIYPYQNDTNYTFFIKPWNPCNEGQPVLAQNTNRECFIKYDLNNAMDEFNIYKSNNLYSNINMKYIFESPQCVNNILNGNISINETIIFPNNFTISLCENYYIEISEFNNTLNKTINKEIINKYFNSSYCNILRNECNNNGYYSICLDYISSICTCYCPRDKKGINCEEYRDYNCKLNILNANMTKCELMTQEEINLHGRNDYDVNIDGDKPCFFINDDEDGFIESVIQLNCYFIDSISNSKVWEELIDYKIYNKNITFNYCLGNETSKFALTLLPPKSILRLKIFNFERIFSENETYIIPLNINHWSGDKYIFHNKSMKTLNNKYKIGGRIYIEYQLWQMDKNNKQQNRINVERRFYDINNWVIPKSNNKKFNNSQKWFIIIITCLIFVLIIYCIYQCNKWCKKLEHEKID